MHSLSDPELEHSLITRIDFNLFCRFDELSIPDYSTLCHYRNRPLTEAQTKRNRYLSKTHYVVEQSFGTLHRKFRYARAAYFGLSKVSAQSHLKAMCLNLLKAANRLSVPAAA